MFHTTRIKLTAWYLLIIMMISVSFSVVIYKGLMNEVERFAQSQRFRIERQLRTELLLPPDAHKNNPILPRITDPDLVADTKQRILLILVLINGGIVFLSGGLGYFLAGKTLRPIHEMLVEQNQFITDASHELRTPLTSIKSSVEVHLRDKKLTIAKAKKLLAENIKDVNKLQRLSDQLLELAQYQKPNGKNTMQKISLKETIKQALRSVEALRTAKSIHIINTTKEHMVVGNSNELTDLFTILIDNAMKYSKEKTTITMSSKDKGGWIHIAVSDSGMGINQKDLPHIFDRFYRADSARLRQSSGGYGLGLSIAKKIADRHNGSITCQSSVGKGSVFTLHIPMTS